MTQRMAVTLTGGLLLTFVALSNPLRVVSCCSGAAVSADTIRGGPDLDALVGTSEKDVMYGGDGADRLTGLGGDDVLLGEAGGDILEGGDGSDILEGGEGDDDLDGGDEQDRLFGDAGDDILRGGAGPDVMEGGPGDDELRGGDGDDVMDAGEGDDALWGGAGDDTMDGGDQNDILLGGPGNDDLNGGDDADILDGGPDDDSVFGGDANDRLAGGAGSDLLFGGDGADIEDGGPGNDEVGGGDGDDILIGGAGDDLLSGGAGNDQLRGGPGVDTLFAQAGDDVVLGGPDDDWLDGGAGEDRLDGGDGSDYLIPGLDTDHAAAGDGDDRLLLRAGDVPDRRVEVIDGGLGTDTVFLSGFGPGDVSDLTSRPPGPDADSTAVAELSLVLTDPYSGGTYNISRIEAIRHVARFAHAEDATLLLLNLSGTDSTRIWVEVLAPDGSSAQRGPEGTPERWEGLLPPRGVLELSTAELATPSPGSVRVYSERPVAGSVLSLFGNTGGAGFADRALVQDWVLPVDQDPEEGVTTALAVAVEGPARTLILKLMRRGGGEVDSHEVEVGADGQFAGTLSDLFPGILRFAGTLSVEGGPMSGASLQWGPDGAGVATYPAIPTFAPHLKSPLYFPGAIADDGTTAITVINRGGDGRAGGVVQFFDANGFPASVEIEGSGRVSEQPFDIAALGSARLDVTTDAGPGSIRIVADSGAVGAVVRGRRSASGVVGAGPSPTGTRFVAPVVERAAESLSTSIFVQGTGEETTMRLALSDAEGNPVGGEASLTVPARGTVTATLSELFPSLDSGDFLGAVTGSSAAPVAMSVVLAGHGRESGLSMPVDASGGGPGSE